MGRWFGPFRFLYKLYFGILFVLTLLLYFPVMVLFIARKEWYGGVFYVRMLWARTLALLSFSIVIKKRLAALPDGPFIICSNHQSYFDIVYMYIFFSRHFVFIGKHELSRWPLFGMIFRRTDIPVDRDRRIAAARALDEASKRLDQGQCVAIFPEGTIPEHTPRLKRFKNGAFSLAIKKQVPIVPVTILTHYKRFSDPGDLFGPAGPGMCRAIIHEAIETKGMSEEDLLPLRQRVFELIEETLKSNGSH